MTRGYWSQRLTHTEKTVRTGLRPEPILLSKPHGLSHREDGAHRVESLGPHADGRRTSQGLARTVSGRVVPGRFALCLTRVFFRRSDRKGVRSGCRRPISGEVLADGPANVRQPGLGEMAVATKFPAEKGLRRVAVSLPAAVPAVATKFPAEKGLRPVEKTRPVL